MGRIVSRDLIDKDIKFIIEKIMLVTKGTSYSWGAGLKALLMREVDYSYILFRI